MFDVGDSSRNAVLTGCFAAIVALTIASIVPWHGMGAARISRIARWFPVPVLFLALTYESTMPSHFNIRVDLLLLLPMYGIVIVASLVRWIRTRNC